MEFDIYGFGSSSTDTCNYNIWQLIIRINSPLAYPLMPYHMSSRALVMRIWPQVE